MTSFYSLNRAHYHELILSPEKYYKILFIVLSLAAALLLSINSIIEVKSLPTHRDSATLHSGVTELHYLLVIPFVWVEINNFLCKDFFLYFYKIIVVALFIISY